MPGFRMLDEIFNSGPDSQRQVGRFNSWATDSVERLKQLGNEKHADDISRRIEEAQRAVQKLPPTDSMKQAVVAGVEVTRKAVYDALVENAAAKPLNRLIKL